MLERDVVKVDSHRVAQATSRSFKRQQDAIKDAFSVFYDPEHEKRLDAQKCVSCYYLDRRIVQQAFFTQPCGKCSEPQIYANSNTDVLCLNCACKNNLCRHCGGNLLKYIQQGTKDATGTESSF